MLDKYWHSSLTSASALASHPRFWFGAFIFSTALFALYIYNSWSVDVDVRYLGPAITIVSSTATSLRGLIHDATVRSKQSKTLSTRVISQPVIVQASGINYALSYADFAPKDSKVNIDQKEKPDPFDSATKRLAARFRGRGQEENVHSSERRGSRQLCVWRSLLPRLLQSFALVADHYRDCNCMWRRATTVC